MAITKGIKMSTLAQIRARLAESDNRTAGGSSSPDNTIFPHWNIDEGKSVSVRFLPDANPNNTFFWIERQMIRLEFSGVKGGDQRKAVNVRVPCVEMWNESCPILAEVRPWYKDESLKQTANKYWKKRDFLFQGFVHESPLQEESTPENPIRRFMIGPQIFNVIKAALMDPELEELPTDYEQGLDFRITKTKKGEYADYSTSTWARRESALTSAERAAIEQYGLFDLSSFLPKKPTDVELKVMFEMFEASVDGQLYDPERWGNYFRPAGMQTTGSSSTSTPASDDEPVSSPVKTESKPAPEPAAESVSSAPAADSKKAEDILAKIRQRQTQS